jgi:hypothetical protein
MKTFVSRASCGALAALALVAGGREPQYEIVQVTDRSRAWVATVSELIRGRYVLAEEKVVTQVAPGRYRAESRTSYAFDCAAPIRVAVLGQWFNLEAAPDEPARWAGGRVDDAGDQLDPAQLEYETLRAFEAAERERIEHGKAVDVPIVAPATSTLAGEFACSSALHPERSAKRIAAQLAAGASVDDIAQLACTIPQLKGDAARSAFAFSETRNWVQVNRVWKTGATVDRQSISWSDAQFAGRVDRRSGAFTLTHQASGASHTGHCEPVKSAGALDD